MRSFRRMVDHHFKADSRTIQNSPNIMQGNKSVCKIYINMGIQHLETVTRVSTSM